MPQNLTLTIVTYVMRKFDNIVKDSTYHQYQIMRLKKDCEKGFELQGFSDSDYYTVILKNIGL